MKRLAAAALLTGALFAPLTPALTATAHAAPGGQCSPRQAPDLVASGTWTASGFSIAGHRDRPRFGRDQWTDITVAGRTYVDVGPARSITRRIPPGALATAWFRGSHMLRDFGCSFRLARAR